MRKSAGEFLSGWTLHCGLWWEERELRLDRIPWKGPFNQHRNGRGGEGLDYQLDMVRHGFVSRNPAPLEKISPANLLISLRTFQCGSPRNVNKSYSKRRTVS